MPILSRDQRFANSPLPPHEQRRLFEAHLRTLYTRRLNLVEGLFAAHSPTLQTRFSDVLPHLTSSPHVKALVGEDTTRLEALYDTWAQRRLERSKQEFQEMLRESAILEHWGRLRKKAEAEGDRDQKIGMGEEGADDDSDEDEDVPSLGEMAKQVDEKAIHSVLKVGRPCELTRLKPQLTLQFNAHRMTSATSFSITIPRRGIAGSKSTCGICRRRRRLCIRSSWRNASSERYLGATACARRRCVSALSLQGMVYILEYEDLLVTFLHDDE